MKPGFVMIAKFDNHLDIARVQNPLEVAGIECWVKDELVNQIDPRLAIALGGISLYVPASRHDEAIQILLDLDLDQYLFAGLPSKTEDKINQWWRQNIQNRTFDPSRQLVLALIFILFLVYICFIA